MVTKVAKTVETFEFTVKADRFKEMAKKIADLAKLGTTPMVKIKLQPDRVFLYSINTTSIYSPVLAFKGYIDKTEHIVDNPEDMKNLEFIIQSPKNFVKNVLIFDGDVTFTLKYKSGEETCNDLILKSGKLKLTYRGGESECMRDLTIVQVKNIIDPTNAILGFKINKDDMARIKKLALANTGNENITIFANGGVLTIGDAKWSFEIGETTTADERYVISKKYLNSIEIQDVANFYIYEKYLVAGSGSAVLMVALESEIG